ncbi:diheme cytochrome C [Pantanalinema sp. GBBB05]|uniref:diheme cytochrome C n=1 Tax=Pantanalinema sp. GBBB05 TaxID=2604139 RepID=UPI001D7FC6BA|nr:diheme cytochrome C [Pantanalinema sp. GBBB05]
MSHPSPDSDSRLLPVELSQNSGRRKRPRSVLVLLILLLLWSLCWGIGLAQATTPNPISVIAQAPTAPSPAELLQTTPVGNQPTIGTIDVVPERYQAGQKLYLENCATCHVGIPPGTMPSETWRQLITDPQHYGAEIRPLGAPEIQVLWNYLRDYSRPQAAEEELPYRLYQSRYFKILHPKVKFPERVSLNSCVSCHPGAKQYNFRSLTSEWQDAP